MPARGHMIHFSVNLALNLVPQVHQKCTQEPPKISKKSIKTMSKVWSVLDRFLSMLEASWSPSWRRVDKPDRHVAGFKLNRRTDAPVFSSKERCACQARPARRRFSIEPTNRRAGSPVRSALSRPCWAYVGQCWRQVGPS